MGWYDGLGNIKHGCPVIDMGKNSARAPPDALASSKYQRRAVNIISKAVWHLRDYRQHRGTQSTQLHIFEHIFEDKRHDVGSRLAIIHTMLDSVSGVIPMNYSPPAHDKSVCRSARSVFRGNSIQTQSSPHYLPTRNVSIGTPVYHLFCAAPYTPGTDYHDVAQRRCVLIALPKESRCD
jgi:hypothetical protein